MSVFRESPFWRSRASGGGIDIIPPDRSAPVIRGPLLLCEDPVVDADFQDLGPTAQQFGARFTEAPRSGRAAIPRPERGDFFARWLRSQPGRARPMPAFGFWAAVAALSAASFWIAGGHALAERVSG